MKKELRKCFTLGFVFISIFGTLLHFVYGWSGENQIVGLFSPVNESIWEHMKLFFFPMFLFIVIMSYFNVLQTYYPALVPGLLVGLLAGTWFIPVAYYAYSGILGRNITLVDVLLFYVAVFVGLRVAYGKVTNHELSKYELPLKICAMIMLALFMLFSRFPPEWGMFLEP